MTTDSDAIERFKRVEAELDARRPEASIKPSLDRIRDLVHLLGSPQHSYPVIHVAGTNGKTTTTRLAESLLRAFGLRTGRFVSPHVESHTERIAVDGEPLSPERFAEVFEEIRPYVEMVDAQHPIPLSYFEILTAMGFAAFADAPVDAAVVEVGLGGSWDATNVADGRVCVIMPVAVDHTKFLGDSLTGIAEEKAGILKGGSVGIIAQQDVDVAEVLLRRSVEVGVTVAREGLEFGLRDRAVAVDGQLITVQGLAGAYEDIFLPLHGAHQAHNAACALAAVEALIVGDGPLDIELVRQGFATATSPGRLEVVRRGPAVILDAAHNPAGAWATADAVSEAFTLARLVGVVSVLADKDVRGILEAFEPVFTRVVVTRNSSHRAVPTEELSELAAEVYGPERVEVRPTLPDAIDTAIALAEGDDLLPGGVLVTGSIVTVGDARKLLRPEGRD